MGVFAGNAILKTESLIPTSESYKDGNTKTAEEGNASGSVKN